MKQNKKKLAHALCILLMIAFVNSVSGQKQTRPAINGIFAGKTGVSGKTGGNYTIEELRKSDWTIRVADEKYTVTEFKMSLVFKDTIYGTYTEYEIKGNTIPENYRDKILTQTRVVYLEYIRAVNDRGELISIKPIVIRVQP